MSFPYQRILCPIDLDDSVASQLVTAAELARHFEATAVVLHVVPPAMVSAAGPGVPAPPASDLNRSREESALARLRESSRDVMAGTRFELMVQLGDPAESILRVDQDLHPDLIVMGTHGRKGLRRLVLGSVAERVIREARCPVLTLKPSVQAEGGSTLKAKGHARRAR
jgi:nucleotide-binding universal stress UspA family protein